MSKVLSSWFIPTTDLTVVSIGGVNVGLSIDSLCAANNIGVYELEVNEGDIFVTFLNQNAADIEMVVEDVNQTQSVITSKPHIVIAIDALVGGRPDGRFKPVPQK